VFLIAHLWFLTSRTVVGGVLSEIDPRNLIRYADGYGELMIKDQEMNADRADVIARVRELIEALDRRVPQLEREGEAAIARDAAALKQKALQRIAELQTAAPAAQYRT
jgi:hypothetical protein